MQPSIRLGRGVVPAAILLTAALAAVACTSILGDFEVTQGGVSDAGPEGAVDPGPDAPSTLSGIGRIAVGGNFACAVRAETEKGKGGKMAWCWGDNSRGQTGQTTGAQTARPAEFPGLGTLAFGGAIVDICAGNAHACVSALQGSELSVWCWGSNEVGQLGIGAPDNVPHPRPEKVALPGGFDGPGSVACGAATSCAVSSNGSAACWGSNRGGMIQRPVDSTISRPPTGISNFATSSQIDVGEHHGCAIGNLVGANPFRVHCWGNGVDGELGNGTTGDMASRDPTPVTGLPNLDLRAIRVGHDHACSLDVSGQVFCWGKNDLRQADPADPATQIPSPTKRVVGGLNAERLSVGHQFSCAAGRMKSNNSGAVMCWGSNSFNQLGILDGSANVAIVSGLTHPVDVGAGGASSCAVEGAADGDTSGTVYCWGKNDAAQLGTGDNDNRPTPTPVRAPPLL